MMRVMGKYSGVPDTKIGHVCFKRELKKGRTITMHWHDYIEIEFIISGKVKHTYNKEESILQAGSAYILGYHDCHEITTLTEVCVYSIHIDQSLLDKEIVDLLSHKNFQYNFNKEELKQILEILQELEHETYNKNTLRNVLIKSLVNELAIRLILKCTPSQIQPLPLPIQKAVFYMNQHFKEDITLDKMAADLSFSANYLGRLFNQQMKCGFNEYLNKLRIKYACDLLAHTTTSVKEIAFASGYNSVAYFMYAFKKNMAMTPGDYRQNHN